MKTKLSNILLVSDLDDTLLSSDKKISQGNLSAIDKLISHGGSFTVATGRAYQMAAPVIAQVPVTHPVVLYNGAAVYDFSNESFLWKCSLPDIAREHVGVVLDKFPDVGIEVLIGKSEYVLNMNDIERAHLKLENVEYTECTLDECPYNWTKVLFSVFPSHMADFSAYMLTNCSEGVDYIQSSPYFYEMLPPSINKGFAVQKFLELNGEIKTIAAIGDFSNDTEMVRMADIGFAVANATDDVKAVAKYIVSDCNNSPIADVVDILMKL